MNTKYLFQAIGVGLVAMLAGAAWAQEKEQPEGVSLTVYNGGFAVVREKRTLDIANGEVKFTDVPTLIDPTTVHFKSFTDPAAKLIEQNYQFDLVSADKLLQKYLDQPIDVVAKEKTYSGVLMSFDGANLVLKDDKGGLMMVQRADNVRDIHFKALPEGLLTRPTLVWRMSTAKPGPQESEVTYQTGGTSWHAEYVLVLGEGDTTADLSGWISVQNDSGKTYRDAQIKLIAGDVRHNQPQGYGRGGPVPAALMSKGEANGVEQKEFFDYHMYTVKQRSTVADHEVKQLEMFPPVNGFKVEKKYLYNPLRGMGWYGGFYTERSYGITSDKKVQVFIEFQNAENNKLGIPLPAGTIRCYKQDPADKALEFVGEEKIDHTPKDEKLSLQIGNAFDIVGERKQTDFKVESGRKWMSESFEIKIKNHKKAEDVTVRVKEPMYRCQQWKIVESNLKYEKLDAFNVAWDVPVKADGEAVVTYTVEYTW